MKLTAVLLACLVCAAAAPRPEIDTLIDQASGLPGEFAADALLRLAASGSLPAPRRAELVERAFERAAEATVPLRRRAAVHPAGYPMGFVDHAYDQELDALSLRMRAVEAMLALDRRKAREMFLAVAAPQIPRVSCEEYLTYDVSRFYAVLSRVAAETYSPEEARLRQPYQLLALDTGSIASAVAVEPAARAIAAAEVSDGEFQALVAGFSAALRTIAGDDRSFTAASRGAGAGISALIRECRRRVISETPLLEAYRLYLVNNLSGPRCADSTAEEARSNTGFAVRAGAQTAADPVTVFNNLLPGSPVQPITAGEVTPSEAGARAKLPALCQDADCQAIGSQYRALVFGQGGVPYPDTYRNSDEFKTRLRDFLLAMASWKESPETTAADHYRQKATVFSDLFNLLPPGPERDAVAEAMIGYLGQNRFETVNPVEWFLPVNTLIGRAGSDPSAKNLAAELRAAPDRIVAFYARLEAVAPLSPDRLVPLM